MGAAANDSTGNHVPPYEDANSTYNPERLASWREFHQRVEGLPEAEREVFELLWYQSLTQAEVAGILGISVPTVKRRWLTARLQLQERLPNLAQALQQ